MGKKNNPPYEREVDSKELYALWNRLAKAQPGKEMREVHKELKKYGYGVPFFGRYPNSPLVISIIALLVVSAKEFLA